MPATTQAPSTSAGVPTACAMAADLRKTPVPIVIPTTREVAWVRVRSRRGSSWVVFTAAIVQSPAAGKEPKTMAGYEYHTRIHRERGTAVAADA